MKVHSTLIFALALNLSFILGVENTIAAAKLPIPTENEVLFSLGNPSQKALPRRINLLVWNLHKGANGSFTVDFNDLAFKKDLLINQEMQLDERMETAFLSLPENIYSTATSFFIGKELYRTGVSTGSQVQPIKTFFVKTETLEPVTNSPKVTLFTQYPIAQSSKVLTVVNIHAINFVDAQAFKKEIERITVELLKIKGPILFAGDFNSWDNERVKILKTMNEQLKLTEATFNPDNRLKFGTHPLDHVFYSQELTIIQAKVEDFYKGSDHKPLELIIDFNEQKDSI